MANISEAFTSRIPPPWRPGTGVTWYGGSGRTAAGCAQFALDASSGVSDLSIPVYAVDGGQVVFYLDTNDSGVVTTTSPGCSVSTSNLGGAFGSRLTATFTGTGFRTFTIRVARTAGGTGTYVRADDITGTGVRVRRKALLGIGMDGRP